ncbi:MAG: type II secretion system protein [Lachnospiraceae bacterium]
MRKNKGFSMVELIIVIAIMAILAGALAPALIKYINKSRLSTDIQTGQTVATAIQTALSNEDAFDVAPSGSKISVGSLFGASGTDFQKEFTSAMGTNSIKGKAKKDLDGCSAGGLQVTSGGGANDDFVVDLDPVNNKVVVYRKGTTANTYYEVYPSVDKTHMAK